MRVTTFTLEESTDHTLQMRIHRTSASPTQAINVTIFSSSSTLSTLTPMVSTLPKPNRTRHTSAEAQQKYANLFTVLYILKTSFFLRFMKKWM
jgi:hypothetical protein